MQEMERRSALACLSAVEVNLAELRGIPDLWCLIGPELRQELDQFGVRVRVFQQVLANGRDLVNVMDETRETTGQS